MKEHILRLFRRKRLSKKQKEEFWNGFFSKTYREKHLEELRRYDIAITKYQLFINSLEQRLIQIEKSKKIFYESLF